MLKDKRGIEPGFMLFLIAIGAGIIFLVSSPFLGKLFASETLGSIPAPIWIAIGLIVVYKILSSDNE